MDFIDFISQGIFCSDRVKVWWYV